jgi:hypothetical protein
MDSSLALNVSLVTNTDIVAGLDVAWSGTEQWNVAPARSLPASNDAPQRFVSKYVHTIAGVEGFGAGLIHSRGYAAGFSIPLGK